MNATRLTAEPLNVGAPEIGAPRLGQVHALQAKSLTTKPAEIGESLHRILVCTASKPRHRGGPARGTGPE